MKTICSYAYSKSGSKVRLPLPDHPVNKRVINGFLLDRLIGYSNVYAKAEPI
jgi:hypothetical protein